MKDTHVPADIIHVILGFDVDDRFDSFVSLFILLAVIYSFDWVVTRAFRS